MIKKSLFISASALLSTAIAMPSHAQIGEDEIIVTATKREQTLQEVPIAVSVTSAETIENATILDINDLQTVVPSLRITQLQTAGATNFIIRGFGNGANNAGIEPSVGVFIDGVYRSRSGAQIGDLPRLNRSEVLRGPQSTLFGKNASVGVISLVTEKPSFDPFASIEATYGNFNQFRLKGYASQAITEDIALALSGSYNTRDGFAESLQPGVPDVNDRNRFAFRADVLYQVNDDTELRFIGDYSEIDEVCCFAALTDTFTAAPPIDEFGNAIGTPLNGAALLGALSFPQAIPNFNLSQPLAFNDPNDPFEFTTNVNSAPLNEIQDFGFSGQLDTVLAGLDTTLILSYRENENFNIIDADFGNIDFLGTARTLADISTFTAELRFNGTAFDDRVNWTLGGFYFDEDIVTNDGLNLGVDTRTALEFLGAAGLAAANDEPIDIPAAQATLGGLELFSGLATGTFLSADVATDEVGSLDNQSFNIFGNFDFEVTDKLTLTFGGAYTRDEKDFTISQTNNNLFTTDLELTDRAVVGPLLELLGRQTAFPTVFGGLADVGLIPGAEFTPTNIIALSSLPIIPGVLPDGGAAAFQNFEDGVDATIALSELTNPDTNPLLALIPLQTVPQTLSLPNAFEDNNVVDDDFSFTARAAYDVTENINVYASYSTGFKASSVNLSRNSAPNLNDFIDENGRPIAAAFNILPDNTSVRLFPVGDDLPFLADTNGDGINDSGTIDITGDNVPDLDIVDIINDGIFPAGQLIDSNITDAQIPADGVVNPLTARNFGTRFAAPEQTRNIEIGLKAAFDDFAINLALFDLRVEGFQSNVFVGSGFVLANAGEQSARGIEWDATWTPIDPLTLTFGGTYLDAEFDEFIGSPDVFNAPNDVSGQQPAGIPPLSLTGSATWAQPFSNGWNGFLRGDFSYESNTPILDIFESIDGNAGTVAAAGGTVPIASATGFANLDRTQFLINAGAGLEFGNGFELQGFVRNLTNDQFLVSSFPVPGLTGLIAGYPNAPRTYGITGRYTFN